MIVIQTPSLLIVGIDPGKTGAIAFLNPSNMSLHIEDMPLGKSTTGRDELDLRSLGELLRLGTKVDRHIAVLERVSAMPKDGVAGAFNFGQNYGALRMAIVGHGYEDRLVTPAAWKKYFKLSKDKGVSQSYACSRFPGYSHYFARVKDHGRAEAALIALYGAEVLAPWTLNKETPT